MSEEQRAFLFHWLYNWDGEFAVAISEDERVREALQNFVDGIRSNDSQLDAMRYAIYQFVADVIDSDNREMDRRYRNIIERN